MRAALLGQNQLVRKGNFIALKRQKTKLIGLALLLAVSGRAAYTTITQILETDDYAVTQLASISEHPGFILRDRDGFVGVYYSGIGYPAYITQIPISNLREDDRKDLRRGIPVASRSEVIALLEGFES